jgi:hypothetical protein
MASGIETLLTNVATFLTNISGPISLILLLLGGIMYGLAQTQPPENRGKWQTTAMSMFIGGLIVFAIAMAAPTIQAIAGGLLTS